MDPISTINPKKDSTLAMLLEAQARGWQISYMEQGNLWMRDGQAWASMRQLAVHDDLSRWFDFNTVPHTAPLSDLDIILMRKDPPFDMEYIYTTFLLERAEANGVLVVNKPQSLRDANEKMYTAWFPQCCPPTLVSRNAEQLRAFLQEQGDIILKPLDGMGGASIFRLQTGDPNTSVVIETLTQHQRRFIMAQQYIPEIIHGDKRILMINGEPVPYALARVPAQGETRGNLAAGGQGLGMELSERDYWICQQVGDTLRKKGLMFVGLDVIGDYLTEINVTSPTCIRELDAIYSLNISATLMDVIDDKLPR
jgi:glutathione synthase